MIVPDASVIIKLFKPEESDAGIAKMLAKEIAGRRVECVAPTLLLYEMLSAGLHIEVSLDVVRSLLDGLSASGLVLLQPTPQDISTAENIARTQAPIGGYPALYDSIYHAMAINRGGTFVTADKRHVEKAGSFGSVLLLSDWKPGPTPRP